MNYKNKHQMYTTYTSLLHLVIITRKNFSLSAIVSFFLHKNVKNKFKKTKPQTPFCCGLQKWARTLVLQVVQLMKEK